MKLTYDDAISNFTKYIESREQEKFLTVELTKELTIPPALASVQMLDDIRNRSRKIDFVYYMLKDNGVTIKYKEQELCTFQVTEGMTFDSVEYFKLHPAVYRFFIDTVFGVFLKNSYPLLSESLEAEVK